MSWIMKLEGRLSMIESEWCSNKNDVSWSSKEVFVIYNLYVWMNNNVWFQSVIKWNEQVIKFWGISLLWQKYAVQILFIFIDWYLIIQDVKIILLVFKLRVGNMSEGNKATAFLTNDSWFCEKIRTQTFICISNVNIISFFLHRWTFSWIAASQRSKLFRTLQK